VSAVDAIALVVALLVAALMMVALLFPERF
jgi:hypothetical protein